MPVERLFRTLPAQRHSFALPYSVLGVPLISRATTSGGGGSGSGFQWRAGTWAP